MSSSERPLCVMLSTGDGRRPNDISFLGHHRVCTVLRANRQNLGEGAVSGVPRRAPLSASQLRRDLQAEYAGPPIQQLPLEQLLLYRGRVEDRSQHVDAPPSV